jgi:ElaB/YqjD/DUF883 family membrane-anchored ribosome-binding protein
MAQGTTRGKEDLEQQFHVIRDDITTLTKLLKEIGEGKAGETRDKAMAEASELLERSQKSLDEARARAMHTKETVEDYITEKPVQSALIALGVGVVLGWMTRR